MDEVDKIKRSRRRHSSRRVFLRRVNWFVRLTESEEEVQRALKGESWMFLRSTSRWCNCWACKKPRYNRRTDNKEAVSKWRE